MNPAETVQLGSTSLRVSRLGLGGGPLAGLFQEVSEAQAAGAVEQALEAGIRLFDTAPLYGHGLSEQRIGQALRPRDRASFVLASKAGRLLLPLAEGEEVPSNFANPLRYRPVFDFTYDGVMRSFESSLKRLNLDRIDILYIHDPDDHFEEVVEGAYPAVDSLRRQRVVGAVGAAMNPEQLGHLGIQELQIDRTAFNAAVSSRVVQWTEPPQLRPSRPNLRYSNIRRNFNHYHLQPGCTVRSETHLLKWSSVYLMATQSRADPECSPKPGRLSFRPDRGAQELSSDVEARPAVRPEYHSGCCD